MLLLCYAHSATAAAAKNKILYYTFAADRTNNPKDLC